MVFIYSIDNKTSQYLQTMIAYSIRGNFLLVKFMLFIKLFTEWSHHFWRLNFLTKWAAIVIFGPLLNTIWMIHVTGITSKWCYIVFALLEVLHTNEALFKQHTLSKYLLIKCNAWHRFYQIMLHQLPFADIIMSLVDFIHVEWNQEENSKVWT